MRQSNREDRLAGSREALAIKSDYMQTLIIEVSGGVVQEVYCDTQSIRVIKVDWDAGESPGDAFQAGEIFVQSMSILPNETREAIAML
jgi:hypothetical protein